MNLNGVAHFILEKKILTTYSSIVEEIHKLLNVDMVQFEEVWSHFNNFSALIKYKKNVKCHLK
jgi:DNA-directed RNA polymerase delta subunit